MKETPEQLRQIAAEAQATKLERDKSMAEEIAVSVVALILLHGIVQAEVNEVGFHALWDAAREFVEIGKTKLKADVLADLVKP